MIKPNIALLPLTLLMLSACSGSSNTGGNPRAKENASSSTDNPKTAEAAIAKLSTPERASFENWKGQLIKTCNPAEVFGLEHIDSNERGIEKGIDGGVFLQKNKNSVIFLAGGNFAMISSYSTFGGTSTAKREETHEFNGQSYTISAETKREGSTCEVYLYGQKVFETTFIKSFEVGSGWELGKQAAVKGELPQFKALASPVGVADGAVELTQHGVYRFMNQAFKPSLESAQIIAQSLGMSKADGIAYFQIDRDAPVKASARIANDPVAVWSNPEVETLIASETFLKSAFDGNKRTLPLEIRIFVPEFTFGSTKNSADLGNLKLLLTMSISSSALASTSVASSVTDKTKFDYSVGTLESQGIAPFDKDEASQCAKDRAVVQLGESTSIRIKPSVSDVFSPCRTLYADIEKYSFQNGLLKSLIPKIFAEVIPSNVLQYNGWDTVISTLALETIQEGKSIRTELDPESKTKMIDLIARNLESIQAEFPLTKNFGKENSSSRELAMKMGLKWSFNGSSVTSARVSQILQSLDHSIYPFQVSTEHLLRDLGERPNDYTDQLIFAAGLDATFKTDAMTALNLSRELKFSDFERDVFNQILQSKASQNELKDWISKFGKIKIEILKFTNLDSVKNDLVGLSLNWLRSGEGSADDLDLVYAAISNTIDSFQASTMELVSDLSKSLLINKDTLSFARAINDEYKQLGIAIRDQAKASDYASFANQFFDHILQNKPTIDQLRAQNGLWSAITAFNGREKGRTQNEFGSTNDWERKTVVDRAIAETWSDYDFKSLEAITEFAKFNVFCERKMGSSARAVCVGIDLFSKKKGKILDAAFGGRYVPLAQDFIVYMGQLQGDSFDALRRSLVRAFFGVFDEPIWSKCDQASFHSKAAALKSEINSIATETEIQKVWELERRVRVTVEECQN